ncbi:MAG: ATP-binding protein [Bacteroidales bacterium]|jgi:predicted AAA+ superfamily ATPase|nr:ATP-binding protein [Bacteroidales bacterium]
MILRPRLQAKIEQSISVSPIVALLGPRQCGKTTISRVIADNYKAVVFDLENPVDYQQLSVAPLITLQSLNGLVIIDEVQLLPELTSILRILADRPNSAAKFLILGSASPVMMKNAAESLAGRVSFIDMSGFNLEEIGAEHLQLLWTRGGFPRSFLGKDERISFKWRQDFIRTFLERDIPQLGISIPAVSLRRFWTMLAHYHGNIWNGSDFARSIGTSEPTARRYLDILSGAFVVNQLQPWHENIKKRQVKSPKVYIRDSGLLHALLSLEGDTIIQHPKLGFSWEGFIIEQLISKLGSPCYFWATYAGGEIDLLTIQNGKKIGFEIKYTDAPRITKSMLLAIEDLSLERLFIIYPEDKDYALHDKIQVMPAKNIWSFDMGHY